MFKFLKNKPTKIKPIPILIFIAVISINLFFGLPRVEKFSAIDEAYWSYERVPKFWKSLKNGNWKGTSLCDKPGVTLAMISGIGLPFIPDPQKYEDLRFEIKTPQQLQTINDIYFFLRLPVYLFTVLSLFGFYYLIKKLFNREIALFSVILIGLSPLLLGISLIVNTDAILWILMPLSLLCFLIYQKENDFFNKEKLWNKNKKFLYLSGFILGLAILNKFVANLLFPFFLSLLFLGYILEKQDYSPEKASAYFKNSLKDYWLLIFIALATIFLFYPKTWVSPKSIFSVTLFSMAFEDIWLFFVILMAAISIDVFWLKSFLIKKICRPLKIYKSLLVKTTAFAALLLISFVALNVFQEMKYYDFESILFHPKSDLVFFEEFKHTLFSAFYPLIFGIPPLTALFFILSIIFLTLHKQGESENFSIPAFSLFFFIMIFYLANSSAQISSTVRYQIVIYPIASILASVGIWHFLNVKYLQRYGMKIKFLSAAVILIVASFFSLRLINPFFLSYSSELLPKKFIANPRDMADGAWEASEYLNNLPHAETLVVWSDKKQVCEKFIGKCSRNINNKELSFDYYVTFRSSKAESFKKAKIKGTQEYKIGNVFVDLPRLYSEKDPGDFMIAIGGRDKNYVKITNASSVKK